MAGTTSRFNDPSYGGPVSPRTAAPDEAPNILGGQDASSPSASTLQQGVNRMDAEIRRHTQQGGLTAITPSSATVKSKFREEIRNAIARALNAANIIGLKFNLIAGKDSVPDTFQIDTSYTPAKDPRKPFEIPRPVPIMIAFRLTCGDDEAGSPQIEVEGHPVVKALVDPTHINKDLHVCAILKSPADAAKFAAAITGPLKTPEARREIGIAITTREAEDLMRALLGPTYTRPVAPVPVAVHRVPSGVGS